MNVLDTHTPALKTAQGVYHLSARALLAGGEVFSRNEVEWDVAGNCQRPVIVHHHGKPSYDALGRVIAMNRYITMHTKCRKCPACLKNRAWHWTMRAKAECAAAKRTWFVTLTLNPTRQFISLTEARKRGRDRATPYESLPHAEQFKLRVRAISPEITKWLKRVRAKSGAKLRYCLVAEEHKSGDPHFHALVHEVGDTTVTERTLRGEWKLGYSKHKLVQSGEEAGAAHYVSKYLAKSALARVRASARYGELPSASEASAGQTTTLLEHRLKNISAVGNRPSKL